MRLSDIVVYKHNGTVLSCKDQDPVTCVNGEKWKTPCEAKQGRQNLDLSVYMSARVNVCLCMHICADVYVSVHVCMNQYMMELRRRA